MLIELANPVKFSGVFIAVLSDSSSVSLFSKYHILMMPTIPYIGPFTAIRFKIMLCYINSLNAKFAVM